VTALALTISAVFKLDSYLSVFANGREIKLQNSVVTRKDQIESAQLDHELPLVISHQRTLYELFSFFNLQRELKRILQWL
jgi:hypothetical protein